MFEEFAIWLGCNPMHGELTLCAVNTLLIAPGVVGMFSIFILYFFIAILLLYTGVKSAFRALRILK
jgi:hypothetical protein